MAPRKTTVEEFDDDTDLPLPSYPLPNAGAHGPILEEIDLPGPASSQPRDSNSDGKPTPTVASDITPYKTWTCIYPIYIDAKRPYGTGERRVSRQKSVWWPLSKDIAEAASRLGLGVLHEVHKSHPRDWENPGRVRVQWKKDGRLVNSGIRSKRQLLEMISSQIQRSKPDSIPKPPYRFESAKPVTVPTPPKWSKGKQAAQKAKQPAASSKPSGRRLPVPPEPQPPLASRVSTYSPALASGVLIETVKAGMNAQEGGPGGVPGASGPGMGGGGKGKRRVVRVRG